MQKKIRASRVIRLLDGRCVSDPPRLVLALGNFDGVHRGHARLMSEASSLAERISAKPGMLCFDPPPADILLPVVPKHICDLDGKLRYARENGLEYAVVCPFSDVRDLSPEEFCVYISDMCGCVGAVCGYNFGFGKNGAGTPSDLAAFFGENTVTVPAVLSEDGTPISSTRVRALIERGDVGGAEKLLGHPFEVRGRVVHGKTVGRQMGLPTLNISFGEKNIIPASGIYVSACVFDEKKYPSVTNIGKRPTFDDGDEINCETHILDYDGLLYDKEVAVELYARIRDERRFPSTDELRAAIERDAETARDYFRKIGK